MRKTRLFVLTAFLGLALTACNNASLPLSSEYPDGVSSEDLGGSITTPWVDYTVPATSVSFPDADKVVNINKGETHTYAPEVSPRASSVGALIFTSQDTTVATMANNVLTAVGGGSTNIIVSSKDNSFSPITLEVNVTVPLQSIEVSATALDLGFGYTEQLTVTYDPVDTTQTGDITFTSLDENVAKVSVDGLVTAGNTNGNTKIKVTSGFLGEAGAKEVAVVVADKVIHVDSVAITNKQDTLEIDKQLTLQVGVVPSNAENKAVTYSSSDEAVAIIDENGTITANKKGTTKITVVSNEDNKVKDEFDLEVFAIEADALVVPASLTLLVNGTSQLHPTHSKAGAEVTPSRSKIQYESDDESIATVSASGLISARAVGNANIIVKDTEGNLQASIPVTVNLDQVVYTIIGFADWTPDDGSDVFAWVWGGDAVFPGAWYKLDLTHDGDDHAYSNVAGTFTAPRNIEGFNLVRCKNGTLQPNWEVTDDSDGRIYNKTANFTVVGATYNALDWVEYPEGGGQQGSGFAEGSYYIVGDRNYSSGVSVAGESWNNANNAFEMTLNNTDKPGDVLAQFKASLTFSITDEWKVRSSAWIEFYIESAGGINNGDMEIVGDNIRVNKAGQYDIYFKVKLDGSCSLYISEQLGEPQQTATGFSVKIGNADAIELTKTTEDLLDTEKEKFFKLAVEVEKDQPVTFYGDGVALVSSFSPDGDGDAVYNNYMGTVQSGLTIQKSGTVDIYLHVWESGWVTFWISGGDSATHVEEPEVVENTYYLIGSFNDWTTSDNTYKLTKVSDINYRIEGVVFEAGAKLKVFWPQGAEEVDKYINNASTWEGCGFTITDDNDRNIVITEAGTYTINLYLDSVDQNYVVPTKTAGENPEPVVSTYYLVGSFNGWVVEDEVYELTKVNENKYTIEGVVLEAGTALKVYWPQGAEEERYLNNASTWENCGFTISDDNDKNVVITDAGTYNIDFYVVGDNNNHIVPNKEGEAPATFEAGTFYVVGSASFATGASVEGASWNDVAKALAMTLHNQDKPEGVENQYKATVEFAANDEWRIRTNNYPSAAVEEAGALGNSQMEIFGDNIKVNVAGEYDIYFKAYSNGSFGIYVSEKAGGGEEPPAPATFEAGTYYVVGSADFSTGTSAEGASWNDVAKALAMTLNNNDKPEGVENQYKATVTFAANDEWRIRTNNYPEAPVENAGAFANDQMEMHGDNIKVNVAGEYNIFFKAYSNGSFGIYVSEKAGGGEEPPAPATFEAGTYYVVGSADFSTGTSAAGASWDDVAKALAMTLHNQDKPEGVENQYKVTVTFAANDEWRIRTNNYPTVAVENAGAMANSQMEMHGDNIKVNTAGQYDIYFKAYSNGNFGIYIAEKYVAPVLTLSATTASVVVGGDPVTITASNVTGTLHLSNSDSAKATAAAEGNTITITPKAAGSTNISVTDDSEAEAIVITVTVSGTKTISVSLGVWENDSARIFAWVWGEGVTSQWIEVDTTNDRIVVPEGVTGFKLVRMNPDGCSLSNKFTYDGLTGTKWNESEDLTYQSGKVLTKPGWDDPFTWETPAP